MSDADSLFHGRLIEAGFPHVYWKKTKDDRTVKESYWQIVKSYWQTVNWRPEKDNTCMNLEALERMNLHFLQRQLLNNVATYVWTGPESKTDATAKQVSESLHQYCQAVRDRQYMSLVASKGERRNPFMLQSNRILEGRLMEVMEKKMVPDPNVETGLQVSAKPVLTRAKSVLFGAESKHLAENYGELPGGPWDYPKARHENALRYGAGMLGVVVFIGPMILMVLVKGSLCRLLTSGLCIVAFALGLALWSNVTTFEPLTPFEMITGTAAYAAVLVVFVGAAM